jgi:hypothetical protein
VVGSKYIVEVELLVELSGYCEICWVESGEMQGRWILRGCVRSLL